MKEIVIRMSEQEYAYMIHKSHIMGDEELYTRHGILTRAFERRTELPKGHGKLKDIGKCDRKLFYQQCGGANSLITASTAFNMLLALPTIIEADKAGE